MDARKSTKARALVVVGAGGNIGSHLVTHLARLPEVRRLTLIDRDSYEAKNLESQEIVLRNLGRPKVAVQRQRLRRINPGLEVRAIHAPVETLPLATLRSDLILACLDSREARRCTNQAAWRLGVPWIDSGVHPAGLLARVNAYVPKVNAPCLECAWSEADYARLEQDYSCAGETRSIETVPTNAPSSLGALAASLQAIEAQKFLSGKFDNVPAGQEVLIDAFGHNYYVTTYERRPQCRFDHKVWAIERVQSPPAKFTLRQALELGREDTGERDPISLRMEGRTFVRKLTCLGCGANRSTLRLSTRLRPTERTCECGRPMLPRGFDTLEILSEVGLPQQVLDRSLATFGLQNGDVFTLANDIGEAHYEIGA